MNITEPSEMRQLAPGEIIPLGSLTASRRQDDVMITTATGEYAAVLSASMPIVAIRGWAMGFAAGYRVGMKAGESSLARSLRDLLQI